MYYISSTSETSTFSVLQNNTTSSVLFLQLITMTAAIQSFVISGLNVAFASTDTIEMKWLTPTWVTNPTGVRVTIDLYFE